MQIEPQEFKEVDRMNNDHKVIKIFTMKQQFPCGPQASCCGPVGQSSEEVETLKKGIEGLGRNVEIYDIAKIGDPRENQQVFKLLRTFGPKAIPIITVGEEVACIGQSDISEIISAIKGKL